MLRIQGTVAILMLVLSCICPADSLAADLQLPVSAPHFEFGEQSGLSNTPKTFNWQREKHAQEIDTTAELTIEQRRKIQARLKLRRKLVPVHQTLAFVAAGSIVAAEIVGMINSVALKSGQPLRGDLEPSLATHRVLAGVATTAYFGSGIVAWAMPPAVVRKPRAVDTSVKKGVDSGKLHEALSVIHGIAMGTVVATGILQANVATGEDWEALVTVHSIAGFTAAGTVIASGIVIATL